MADIYARARHVIIWPGHLPSSVLGVTHNGFQQKFLFNYNDLKAFRKMHHCNRLWILQEIFLAKTRHVIVRGKFVSWAKFCRLFTRVKQQMQLNMSMSELRGINTVTRNPLDQLIDPVNRPNYHYAVTSFDRLTLHDIAKACCRRECSDVRDR